jgi:hypothetical protein
MGCQLTVEDLRYLFTETLSVYYRSLQECSAYGVRTYGLEDQRETGHHILFSSRFCKSHDRIVTTFLRARDRPSSYELDICAIVFRGQKSRQRARP